MDNEHSSWDHPHHLRDFSDWSRDLGCFTKYRNAQIYQNVAVGLRKVLPLVCTVNETGVGGGRSYNFLLQLMKELGTNDITYHGYDISKNCVDFCSSNFGNFFSHVGDQPIYREADLTFFFDVLVHSPNPADFLDQIANSTSQYLCFQTPTRDIGATEYDIRKSCRLQHQIWIPWIVFNVDELLAELRQRGFERFLIIKVPSRFAGNAPRFLPREFYEPSFPSARSAFLCLKNWGSDHPLANDPMLKDPVNFAPPVPPLLTPRIISKCNDLWRQWGRFREPRRTPSSNQ